MIIYLFFLIVCILLFFVTKEVEINGNHTYSRNFVYIFMVVFLFLLLYFFRGMEVGKDTRNYRILFELIQTVDIKKLILQSSFEKHSNVHEYLSYTEPGYLILNKLGSIIFSGSFRLCLFSFCAFEIIILFSFVYRFVEYPWLSVVLWICMGFLGYSLNLTRQMIAVSFTVLAFQCIQERKLLHYLVLVLLAGTIHTTAFIILPMYWIIRIKLSRRMITVATFVVFIFSFYSRQLLRNINLGFLTRYYARRLEAVKNF